MRGRPTPNCTSLTTQGALPQIKTIKATDDRNNRTSIAERGDAGRDVTACPRVNSRILNNLLLVYCVVSNTCHSVQTKFQFCQPVPPYYLVIRSKLLVETICHKGCAHFTFMSLKVRSYKVVIMFWEEFKMLNWNSLCPRPPPAPVRCTLLFFTIFSDYPTVLQLHC